LGLSLHWFQVQDNEKLVLNRLDIFVATI
jgi:hypothetical protein